jgi:hypothetical protein
LRDQLQRLAQQKAPAAEKTIAASKFVESWAGVGDLLRQATPDEQRTIL